MSTLLIEELRTSLTQTFTVKKRREIYAIRPNLLFFNDPSGTFTLSLKKDSTTLGSASLTMAEILSETGWTANQYHWGNLRFLFDDPIILNPHIDYTLELSAGSYTFSESAYLGWIKSYANGLNNFIETADSDYNNPYDFELYSY